ncbi:MAG: winged helix-turn-helix domain-containing protein [Candidatus Acidiferrum sp.]|jgi:Tol biopolymer transport system component/DNA-binding winged helix-turn-helix (wHTH) protein
MGDRELANGLIRFGVFEVDPRSGEVRKSGLRVKLQDQPFKVLSALLERPGEVVSREDLKARIWPNDSFGDFDHAVNIAVAKLRTALADSADTPRYVETLHRRGYRFIFPVQAGNGRSAPSASAPGTPATEQPDLIAGEARPSAKTVPGGAPNSRRWVWASVPVVVIVLAVVWGLRHRAPAPPALVERDMQITKVTNSGKLENVSISPDGRYLVYVLREPGGLGLWTREVGTRSDIRILAPQPGYFLGVTFSRDGRLLYFARGHPTADLYTIPILGGTPRIVLKGVDTPANLSPDGKQFMFVRKDYQRNVAEVRVANADGSGERLVTTIEHAGGVEQSGGSWSPNGSMLAVATTSWGMMHGAEELDVISVADGSRRPLYASSGFVGRPVWLPDGRAIAVVLLKGGLNQIWAVSYPSGELRRITNDLEDYDGYIDVTADGKTIAATSRNATGNIYAIPGADFARAVQLTFGREDLDGITSGPDERLLVHESGSSDGEVWAMKNDGSQRVLFSAMREAFPDTHCGRFVILAGENGRLTRTDADGLNPLELVPSHARSPTCAADGRFVYYADETSRPMGVFRLPIEGGTPVEVTKIPGEGLTGGAAVSPDGKLLAFPYYESGPNPVQRLSVVRLDTGVLVNSFIGVGGYICWKPDGRAIAHFDVSDEIHQVIEQPLAGGAPRPLTKFTTGRVRDFDWSVDGKTLYVSHGEVNGDAVLISNFR